MITGRISLVFLSALLLAGCAGGASKVVPSAAGSGSSGDTVTGVVNRLTGAPVAFGTQIPACAVPQPGREQCHSIIVALGVVGPGKVGTSASSRAIRSYPGGAPYIPMDLWTAYNTYLDAVYSGSGHSIWIVDAFDDPTAEADLQIYRNAFNLPTCSSANGCFHKYNQDGVVGRYPPPDPAGGSGWAVETSLDLDMVSAMCPHCNINLVEANDNATTNLYHAAGVLAASAHPDAISMSFGHAERQTDQTLSLDQFFASGANPPGAGGNLFIASAGDSGGDPPGGPNYPAISQYVMSVGGTTLTRSVGSARLFTETAWSGTGGGCSKYEPKPSWQVDQNCGFRFGNDISAVANPNTGVFVYDSYLAPLGQQWVVVGGTSVAAPLIAGIVGVALNGQSITNNYMYTHTAALNDIVSGSNGSGGTYCLAQTYYCTAAPGQDGPTGWGTPYTIGAL
jgi:subtilase family serine protease